MDMTRFLKDRRESFTKAVMDDDWSAVRAYCKKYGVVMPENETVLKAGIYKAVGACTDIPDEVKDIAMLKCLKLGFNPLMAQYEQEAKE